MQAHRYLPILTAGAALAGLHGSALSAFISVPVQPAGSVAPIPVNKKINLDTTTETQDRSNAAGTIAGTNITVALQSVVGAANLQLKSSRTAPITINGVTVGTLYDRVWCVGTAAACASSSTSNTYILGLRARMNANQWQNSTRTFEINDFFRTIRSAVTADAAYYRGSANPLPTTAPPYTAPPFPINPAPGTDPETASSYKDVETLARTIQGLFEPSTSTQYAAKVTNNAWVDFRTDANINDPDKNNPWSYNSEWSPWMLVRQVCATGYNTTPQAMKMRLWQGGEEGQTPQAILTTAYVCN